MTRSWEERSNRCMIGAFRRSTLGIRRWAHASRRRKPTPQIRLRRKNAHGTTEAEAIAGPKTERDFRSDQQPRVYGAATLIGAHRHRCSVRALFRRLCSALEQYLLHGTGPQRNATLSITRSVDPVVSCLMSTMCSVLGCTTLAR